MAESITRKEFHEMERRIIKAINEVALIVAGHDEKIEANRRGVNRAVGINTVLTGIGSTIAAIFGIKN